MRLNMPPLASLGPLRRAEHASVSHFPFDLSATWRTPSSRSLAPAPLTRMSKSSLNQHACAPTGPLHLPIPCFSSHSVDERYIIHTYMYRIARRSVPRPGLDSSFSLSSIPSNFAAVVYPPFFSSSHSLPIHPTVLLAAF